MKINHKLIRDIIKYIGFGIFIITVIIKLKNLVMHGGTKVVTEIEESDEEDESEIHYEPQTKPIPEKVSEYVGEGEFTEGEGEFTQYDSKITKSPLKRV